MLSFLQYVAKDILAKHPGGLSDVALVFPNKRASLFFNRILYNEVGRPLWSPAYITISELFRQHSDLQVPDQILLVFKLYNTFCNVVGTDEPLDQFYSWGQLMLADFDDLDKNMADAGNLFINLEAWQSMKDFSFLTDAQRESLEQFFGKILDQTKVQQRFNDIWKHLADIYFEYRKDLENHGLAYEGMLYRGVTEQKNISFRYRHYIFVGFNLLQKVEQMLFKRMKEDGRAEFYWDYDEYFMNGDHEAGKYIAKYLDQFPNELSPSRISSHLDYDEIYGNMNRPKEITYISAPTENIQARYVNEWLKKNNRIDGQSRTAIVLADENLLETVIHSLPNEVENVNITTGFPLFSSPVTTLVTALLNLQLRGTVENSDKYRLKYVHQVLRHPYIKYISDDGQALLNELNSYKHYYPSRRILTDGYDEGMGMLFARIEPENGRMPLLSWLCGILKKVGIGSRREKNHLMHEAVFRMYTLINRLDEIAIPVMEDTGHTLDAIDAENGKQVINLSILQKLLTQMIQSTTVPFHGEPLSGIQVMGVLETRNLDFDHVLLLSCNEGNLPKNICDASFIPHSLRAGYELTTVENKVAIYAYYFYSLLQRAGDITITYNNSTDEGQKGEMSRFMLQFMVRNAGKQKINYQTLLSGQSATPIFRRPINKDVIIQKKLDSMESLSPSSINKYLRCPLQFYYSSVCRLREDDSDNTEEINNIVFGNIFHRMAELVYLELSQNYRKTITEDSIVNLKKDKRRLENMLDQAFREILFKVREESFKPQYNGLQRLNKKVVYLYIERMLNLDRQITPFNILSLEQSFYDNLTFTIQGKQRSIMVGGQIDRIDRIVRNGRHIIRVVDYKTGTPLERLPADVSEIFDPKHVDSKHTAYYLQGFLYAGIIRHGENAVERVNPQRAPVSPALFFIRQTATANYDPTLAFHIGKGVTERIDDIDMKYDEFICELRKLIAEIYNPEIPFSPTTEKHRCVNCPYHYICGL